MTRLRVAICGLSPITARRPQTTFFGRLAASHAAGYAALAGCEVVAVCDPRFDLVSAFRDAWADTWPAVAGYTVADQMLAEAGADLVSIGTPDHLHADLVELAFAQGARGVLCETPLATSLADADRMVAAADRAGRHLVVPHRHRYDALSHLVRDAIYLGDIGELRSLRLEQAGPRATLFRNGCHAIDLLRFLDGSPVERVTGWLEPGFEHWTHYQGDGGHNPALEPTAAARLEFASGAVAQYEGLRTRQRKLTVELRGTAGTIHLTDGHAVVQRADGSRTLTAPSYDSVGITAAVAELARLAEEGGQSISDGTTATATVEVLVAVLRSSAQGAQPVTLPLDR